MRAIVISVGTMDFQLDGEHRSNDDHAVLSNGDHWITSLSVRDIQEIASPVEHRLELSRAVRPMS